MREYSSEEIKNIYVPPKASSGEDNGQVTIIGGSSLFHGAPFFSLQAASRIVDMVFFASPEKPLRDVAAQIKASLKAFIWVPWEEVEDYIAKSDAVLIGPGLMRAHSEKANSADNNQNDDAFSLTSKITKRLLEHFPGKKWVIDAGSLQVMSPEWIPGGAILTPNKKEYKLLFGDLVPEDASKKYNCHIVLKGETTTVASPGEAVLVKGGNAGLTKGGTGDVTAGVILGLLAKNDPATAARAGAFIVKAAGDRLYKDKKYYYNADDLAQEISPTMASLVG